MNEASYSKVWTIVGLFTFFCSFNMYLQIQNSSIVFGFPDFKGVEKGLIPIYSLMLFIPTFAVFLYVSNSYLKKFKQKKRWTANIPKAFDLEIDDDEEIGRLYQIFFFFIFYIFPLALQLHSLKVFFKTPVFEKGNNSELYKGFWSHLTELQPFQKSFGNNYKFGETLEQSVTFFPVYTSWLFLIAEITLFACVLTYILKVFNIKKIS